jgi:hypothetical protein
LRILLAPETVAPFTEKVAVPLLIGLLGLAGVIVTAAVSVISGRWAQATNQRRDAYAGRVAESGVTASRSVGCVFGHRGA